ncbi:hypothetical protein TSAR_013189 [Trichomalopsis sarcophagae]|uniref:DNA replication complex GINS protein SLD5 n=1 Tax=Trichomalopsis sarcophagae TaxID=543379 RepID=A0A232ERX6_9HYME|nr:hypothetical protein TSAR_013189 [Trichomalopsis sarcophagae]
MDTEDMENFETENDVTEENTDNIENIHIDEPEIEESDDEEMTAAQAIQALENAWLNEKFAPELLPHQLPLVETMLEHIVHMENNLKKLKKGDIRLNIHTMELSRIRFVISSYLRKRLEKIEEYAIHLLSEDANRDVNEHFMTTAEAKFAREYISSVENLFNVVALQYMPPRIKEFELNKMASKPNMNKHVFVSANKAALGILIPGNDIEVDFEEGSQHIIQYSAIAHLVKTGDVQLM